MKVIVVGGGVGGLELVRNLRDVEVTLIEPRKEFVCQALLPEFVVGKIDEHEMKVRIADLCDRLGVDWMRDKAVKVESDRVITERNELEFDYLVISIGAKPLKLKNTYGLDRACKDALRDAQDVVVIGSGVTGVECAFELVECGYNVKIIEYCNRILPMFSKKVSSYVERLMKREKIDVIVSCRVLDVDKCVKTDLGDVEYDLAISCIGLKPNPLEGLKTKNGWIVVDDFLRVKENIFAIGDCAYVNVNGEVATKTALEAERQAKITAKNITRLIKGEKLLRYKISSSLKKPTTFITLGRERAILIYKGLLISRPMRILYRIRRSFIESFMKRYKT